MHCAGDDQAVGANGGAGGAAAGQQTTPTPAAKKGKAVVGERVDVQLVCHTEQCIRVKKPP